MQLGDRLYQKRRRELVENLRKKGIDNEAVLEAIGTVLRHLFVEPALRARAYYDQALPIGLRQTISQPFTVAYQTMLLDPKPGERILEVGTGSGYQAAVLSAMGVRLFSIERHELLLARSREVLARQGYRVVTRRGDGTLGWAACAPFDGIIVTAAAAKVPDALLEQLRRPNDQGQGGRLIIPIGGGSSQTMTRITCVGSDAYEVQETNSFCFVPLVSGQ